MDRRPLNSGAKFRRFLHGFFSNLQLVGATLASCPKHGTTLSHCSLCIQANCESSRQYINGISFLVLSLYC